jgi:hypothetical protein
VDFRNYTDDIFALGDIRRYPSELARVPSRGSVKRTSDGRGETFLDVANEAKAAYGGEASSSMEPATNSGKPFSLWEKDGFGFGDFIDIINPLHHIPIVATLYRNLSGDQIGAAPRVIGGALWGRIGGLVTGIANAVVEWWSGKDIGDHVYAVIFNSESQILDRAVTAKAKEAPGRLSPGSVSAREGSKPRAGDRVNTTPSDVPVIIMPDSEAGSPATLRFDIPLISRAAHKPYEKNRNWVGSEDSMGVRFQA